MCLGFITGSFCLVRTVLNHQALPLDRTYDGIINWLWRLFEVTIGIIAACIPTLRPLYTWVARRMKGEKTDVNIKWTLTSQPTKKWSGNVEEARNSDSDEARDPVVAQDIISEGRHASPLPRDRRRDTMRDDLVNQGIIKTEVDDVAASHSESAEKPKEDAGLANEMQKYGID